MNKRILGILAGAALLTSFATILPDALAKDNGENQGDKIRTELKSIGSTLEVHIYDNGKVLVRGAKVTAVGTNTVSANTVWGATNLAWTVNTDNSTEFVKNSSVSAISVGDYISFNGNLVVTSSGLTVNAKTLKDWSAQKKNASFIGKVTALETNSFTLTTEERGNVTVNVGTATAITKGDAQAAFGDIHVGDKVMANGSFNSASMILDAKKIKIYVNKTAEQGTFEGALKAIAGTTAPTYLTLTRGEGGDITVNIPAGISIVNKLYLAASLSDFKVGDKIRVWGLGEGATIDATVVRNTSLPR